MSAARLFNDLPTQSGPNVNLAKARQAWGKSMPDWVLIFAEQCDRTSVRAAAERLRYSPSVGSQILSNSYQGRLDKVEAAVRGAFMGATVECPVLGELPLHKCLYHQGRKFASTNPTRVKLSRTCPTCPNFKKAQPASQPEGDPS